MKSFLSSLSVDILLSKALVADPAQRPADLSALGQALRNTCPRGPRSIDHIPMARESIVDFDIDVSLSLLPPRQKSSSK